jgi:hypothetical protein
MPQNQQAPVHIVRTLSDNSSELELDTDDEATINTVLTAFGVDTVEELAQQELSDYDRKQLGTQRLGIVTTEGGDERTFHSEVDLLARVDGIDEELAAGLIDWCGDIPTICEGQRSVGDVFLGDLAHDAEVDDREWADALRAFCNDLGPDGFEARLKDAGVWNEPESVPA